MAELTQVPGKIFSRGWISTPLFWVQRRKSIQTGGLSAVAIDVIPGETWGKIAYHLLTYFNG